MNLRDLNVVFVGCARDCGDTLKKSLENIKIYSSLFNKSYQVIVENGSKDKTREILKENQNQNNFYLFEDHLDELLYRGQRLEKARNIIIQKIKSSVDLSKCNLLIVLDLDGSGNYLIKNKDILDSLKFLYSKESIGAVFANQLGTYYDMWTLRDDTYCKNDFWAEVLKNIIKKILPKEKITNSMINEVKKNFVDKNTFTIEKNLPPIKVKSAFGGFGIYKMNYVLKNKRQYVGTQTVNLSFKDNTKAMVKFQKCEHVNFNFGFLDQNLELYIMPSLINRDYLEVTFPPQAALNLIIKR
mgnify:FL=1|tara:strand:+ start:1046 stop:1942 length:897 start_codon:yes stop_codon:yes gene_type:complete